MKNGKDRLDHIEELLNMNAVQTVANTKAIEEMGKEFTRELRASRAEHDREMKEIRGLFKQMIRRIAV